MAPPPQTAPRSFKDGRYTVKGSLGEGGTKSVYLAHDTLLDRDVAFALIKTQGLDDIGRERVLREAQAMGRLGDHPNIVQLHDLGEENGQPYMVLPVMTGGAIDGLIDSAPEHRLPLKQAIDIAGDVCNGLQFAHSKGVIHRDLKPGNVWLTAEGTAKIGDFGLAIAADRSRLTQANMVVGTPWYMAPEQAMGGEVDNRSDLYSLGCMLYHMVAGRAPFLGDDPLAILGQHINTAPVAPTWHNSSCTRPLEALILRLMAKAPAERPESAADVLLALQSTDATMGDEVGPAQEDANTLDSLAGGVFVGRQREMGELKAALEDALSGRGRLVTLVGEAGIGKTRTAQELTTYAGLRGARVLWGRCYEDQGAPPYWPWVQAVRSYVRDHDPQVLHSDMGAGAADIAAIVSDVAQRLPDVTPSPALTDQADRFRLFDSITTFLKSAATRQPLVLMLDDLHWADESSLLLLQFVTRELSGARLLLVGTCRIGTRSRQHPLAATLAELARESPYARVDLKGLTQKDVGRFIEVTSGSMPPSGLVEAVYAQTEGNPLFVTEVVRLLVQEGELTPDSVASRKSWTVTIPEGVREVIGRRLDRLSERCNQTLTVASVIGREFTVDQLRPLTDDLPEERLLDVLEEALSARVIEELPQDIGRYQFTHALIQDTLAGELSITRRVRLHARVAEALEGLYGANAADHAAELAHYFAEAEAVLGPEKLVRYSLIAGERALAASAYEEALAHLQRALVAKEGSATAAPPASESPGPAPDAEASAILYALGQAQGAVLEMHERQRAVISLTRAFDYYAGAGDVAQAVAVAEFPLMLGFGDRGMAELSERALELVPPESREAARLLTQYGLSLYVETADYDAAQEALERAMVIARREKDQALELQALSNSAHVDFDEGRFEVGVEKNLRAVELALTLDDRSVEMHGRLYAAASMTGTGDLEGALEHAQIVLELAETERIPGMESGAIQVMQAASHMKGDWASAREFCERGLALEPTHPLVLGYRALLEYELGEFGEGDVFMGRLLESMRLVTPGPNFHSSITALIPPMVARITGVGDHLDAADAAAQAVLSSPAATPNVTKYATIGASLMAVHRGDTEGAARQYSALEDHRGAEPLHVARLRGLLSRTMGKLDDASAHFDEALSFYRKSGYGPELAWTCFEYADVLLQRDGPGDGQKAASLLDESLAISQELGMRPLMERVLARRNGPETN